MKKALLFVLALVAIPPIALEAQSPNSDRSLVNDLYEARTCRSPPVPPELRDVGIKPELECTFELPGLRFQITTKLRGEQTDLPNTVQIFELRADSRYRITALNDCIVVRYQREVGDFFYDPDSSTRNIRLALLDRHTGDVGTLTDVGCLLSR